MRPKRARLTSVVMMVALLVPALSPALGGVLADHASWRWIFAGMLPRRGRMRPRAGLAARRHRGGRAATARCTGPGPERARAGRAAVRPDPGGPARRCARPSRRLPSRSSPARPMCVTHAARPPRSSTWSARAAAAAHGHRDLSVRAGSFRGEHGRRALPAGRARTERDADGALMLPWAAASFLAIAIVRRGFPAWGARPLFFSGIAVDCAGIVLLATPIAMHEAGRVLAFAAMGFGASLCTSTSQSAAFLDVPSARMGEASALWNINRQLSFCIGVAVLGSALNFLLPRRGRHGAAGVSAMLAARCLADAAAPAAGGAARTATRCRRAPRFPMTPPDLSAMPPHNPFFQKSSTRTSTSNNGCPGAPGPLDSARCWHASRRVSPWSRCPARHAIAPLSTRCSRRVTASVRPAHRDRCAERDCRVAGGAVVAYRETQTDGAGCRTVRRATVVFERDGAGRIAWRHLHETAVAGAPA